MNNNQELKIFRHLFKIQWTNYWKDIMNLFSGTILLILTLSIWMIVRSVNGFLYDNYILASCIGVSAIRTGMNSFSKNITNVQNVVKIRALINFKQRLQVYFAIFTFNHAINLCNVFLLIGYSLLFQDQSAIITNINIWMVIYAYILITLTSNAFTLCLHLIVKNREIIEVMLELNYFTGVYLLGLVIPFTLIANHKSTMIASYFVFYRYAMNIICAGWMNGPNFIINNQDGTTTDLGYYEQAWIPYVVSLLILLFLLILAASLIYSKFVVNKKSYKKKIIRARVINLKQNIKKIKTKEELLLYCEQGDEQKYE